MYNSKSLTSKEKLFTYHFPIKKNNLYVLIILFFLPFLSSTIKAQNSKIQKFSSDSGEFYIGIRSFLSSERRGETEELINSIQATWSDSGVSKVIINKMSETCNLLIEKKFKGFPAFKMYILFMDRFIYNDSLLNSELFNQWHEVLYEVIKTKKIIFFKKFIESSKKIFDEKMIHSNKRIKWTAVPWDFNFEFKNNTATLTFNNPVDLICYTIDDSTKVYNTKGYFDILETKWYGEYGTSTWERVLFNKDSVYATFDNYQINLNFSKYAIKKVKFYNNTYFKNYLIGEFEENVKPNISEPEKELYPKFESIVGRLKLNLTKGVFFEGGFSLHGQKIIGVKTANNVPAVINVFKDDTLRLSCKADRFSIRPTQIASQNSKISLYLKEDSIYHLGLKINLNTVLRIFNGYRDNKGIRQTNFYSSFHNMEMDFEQLSWYIDDPNLKISNTKGNSKTNIRLISNNFFTLNDYKNMIGIGYVHPFYTIKKLSDQIKSKTITLKQYSNVARYSQNQLKNFLLKLSYMGFIELNYKNEEFTLRDKLINWFRSSGGNIDYDVIILNSTVPEGTDNGKINLSSGLMKLEGVNSIHLSDSQNVTLYPKNGKVILGKDRDLQFDGIVRADRLTMFGSGYYFDYEEFKIDMPKIDALAMRTPDFTGKKDKYGKIKLRKVQTVIKNIRGNLFIDKPNNKSGTKNHPEYPIFNSFSNSYVYWNRKVTLNGIYKKEKFYFEVDPFTLDSLKTDESAIKFEGNFISYNIFPDFRYTLTVQPDYSLGFIKETPESGYPIYGGKGNYNQTINLSNKGLRGDGILSFLTSKTYSDDFIFYPDSTLTTTKEFSIKGVKEGTQFPDLISGTNKMKWYPYKDIMHQKMTNKPFLIFKNKSKLYGHLTLSPKGLYGLGLLDFTKGEIDPISTIHFKHNEFLSDSADLRIKNTENIAELSFTSNNVKTRVSFDKQKGWFQSNGDGSKIRFPKNKYYCLMEKFTWDLVKNNVILSANGEISTDAQGNQRPGAKFVSTKKIQDSLTFYSGAAQYNIQDKIIYADEIKYINLADAIMFPDSGKIVIEEDAYMRPLKKAKITANYITKNHNMYDVTLQVNGKNDFEGKGFIDYINYKKDTQKIFLDKISVDSTNQTYANSKIPDSTILKLSPHFDFYGNISIKATQKQFLYTGYTRIKHKCTDSTVWFYFSANLNPDQILIPLDSNSTSPNYSQPIVSSILLGTDSIHLYSRFLEAKKRYSHIKVLPADGFIKFNKTKKEYQVSSKEKFENRDVQGNFMSLKLKNCRLYGEGKINLGLDLGMIKINSSGIAQYNTINNEVIFDMLMIMDFPFNQEALKHISENMEKGITLGSSVLDRRTFEKGLRELLGEKEANNQISQTSIFGKFKDIPEQLEKTFFINDLKMKWDKEKRAFVSFGEIGITNIKNRQLNKQVQGKIELVKKRSGDLLKMYLEISPVQWYFFSYARNILQFYSSDSKLNEKISDAKQKDRKFKGSKGEIIQYMLSTNKKKEAFLKKD